MRRAGLALLACLSALGCAGDPFSEVLIIVDAEEGVQTDAARLRLVAWAGDEPPEGDPDVPLHTVIIGDDEELSFPYAIGFSPVDGDAARRFRFEAAALDAASDTDPIAVVRATTGFVSGEVRQLRLVLEDACIPVDCAAPLTCREGHCVNADIDGATLPPYGVVGCGDGLVDAAEECDDANLRDGDGCGADCTVEGSCDAPIDVTLAGATLSDGATVLYGSTSGQRDHGAGSCGGAGVSDVVFVYVPEEDGRVEVSTEGTGTVFDTVIYARSSCSVETTELGCNDNLGSSASRMQLEVLDGEPVYLFVDGANAAAEGAFQLTLRPSGGPGTDCTNPIPVELDADGVYHVTGTSTGALDDARGGCATGESAPDVVFELVPELDGRVGVSTAGSFFDTVVFARTTCDDPGSEVGCDDDGDGANSRMAIDVSAGQPVYVFVDGGMATASGSYELDIWYVADPVPGTCDAPIEITDLDEGGLYVDSGSTARAFDDLAPMCVGNSGPERVYHFRVPEDGRFIAATNVGTVFDTVLYARHDCATGMEIVCDDNGVGAQSRVQSAVSAGDDLFVVVDGARPDTRGDYSLSFRYVASPVPGTCESPTLLALPGTAAITDTGSTSTGFDDGESRDCGNPGGLDVVYELTTPGPGRVGLSTEGATVFDTVLHARSTCDDGMTELGCDDNGGGAQSRLEILNAPTPLYVFVDGKRADTVGDYSLTAWYEPSGAPGTCTTPIGVDLMGTPVELMDNLFHRFDDTRHATCRSDGPDIVYRVVPSTNGMVTVSVTATGWTPVIYAGGDSCSGAMTGTCNMSGSPLTFPVLAGLGYFVAIDSLLPTAGGPFSALFSLSPTP